LHGIPDELHSGEDGVEGGNGMSSRQPLGPTIAIRFVLAYPKGGVQGKDGPADRNLQGKTKSLRCAAPLFDTLSFCLCGNFLLGGRLPLCCLDWRRSFLRLLPVLGFGSSKRGFGLCKEVGFVRAGRGDVSG
ncbi:MAG: hypothetical protein M3Z35_05870, partial [Nitrospirota bacterium]|nr:hypothetical protein [Nitrospirota bacterium]